MSVDCSCLNVFYSCSTSVNSVSPLFSRCDCRLLRDLRPYSANISLLCSQGNDTQ